MQQQESSSDLVEVQTPIPIQLKSKILYIISLSLSTVVLIATFVISGLANSSDPQKFDFKNTTGDISNMYYTHITPAGWAFSIWGPIYAWQALWMTYGWSLVIRPSFPITISPSSLIFYVYANISNITWAYVWGNGSPQYAFPSIVFVGLLLYTAIAYEATLLYQKTTILEKLQKFKVDLYLARVLVLNGLVIYATWITAATLVNFAVVLQYYYDYSSENAGTVGLSLLTVEIIAYFVLENTVLDSFARPVIMVYPVIIWVLSAVINAHWGDDDARNNAFTLVLLILSVILLIVRIIIIIVFGFVRPIKYPK